MKRIFSFILASMILAIPLFALGNKDAPMVSETLAPITIRVGALKGPTGIGMIRLFETAPQLPQASSATFEAIPSADVMAARLLSGQIDAAVLPVNMAAKLYNSGLGYRLVAVVGNGMVKLVSSDMSLTSLGDLRGRDLYVAGQGATPEFLMRTILPKAGLNPNTDLNMIFSMPYPEIAASLSAGRIESAVLPEPFATMALKGNPAARVPFSLSDAWTAATGQSDYPMSVFVVRSSLIEERPEAVVALAKAYEASIAGVLADPVSAGILVEKHDMGLKAAIASAAIPACAFTYVNAKDSRPAIEALLGVFLNASPASIGSKLPDGDWYATITR
ncbi:MAG: MqnA/MqnD/SBP family protein [Spirochaetia bacterium]|nr:MqnA/MqnD/SBP family protein [Spirochaetia bacterium]